ncbi:MAG: pilus assembly PilX N-terminal domain-containing protein [Trueperaceae bacterium]|nr:pilus assembly PilX N-terminal domain-containing protein [Trueperaceae bacterium]
MRSTRQQGIALVSALIFLVISVIFVGTALVVSSSNKRLSTNNLNTTKAQLMAEASIERLIYEIWYSKTVQEASKDFESRDLTAFRKGLDELGILEGEASAKEYVFGPEVTYTETGENGSYLLKVRRVDLGSSRTLLRVDTLGWIGPEDNPVAQRRISEDLAIQPPDLPGFALLTNNANCVLCHLTVSSLDVAYDDDGTKVDFSRFQGNKSYREAHLLNKERIKVGALESLDTHRAEIDSWITGTIYTRGETNVLDSAADLYLMPFLDKSSRLSDEQLSKSFEEVDCSKECKEKNQLFYTNYPLKNENPPDGELPDRFPLPVEDSNENRLIDASEWTRAIAGSDKLGALKGGEKTLYQPGLSPQAKNGSVELSAKSTNGVDGNLVLKGTAANPILLQDDVYVNGDVVISGYVSGTGRIIARGNVYVVGDIKYACDTDSQDYSFTGSVTCNYGVKQSLPQFALVAGKNMMIGPYMMQHLGTPVSPVNKVYEVPAEHLTDLDLSDLSQDELNRWYLDPGQWVKDADGNPLRTARRDNPNVDATYTMSFSHTEAALFNQLEYEKAQANPGYTPRYYRMRDDSHVYRCTSDKSSGCRYYGNTDYVDPGKDTDNLTNPELVDMTETEPDALSSASILSLTPSDSWLADTPEKSELALRKMWAENVEISRLPGALQVDGILYSSNAIFTLAPSKSAIQGQVKLHGSIIAADTGLLVPGNKCSRDAKNCTGLEIFYDSRLKNLLDIQDDKKLVQIRSGFRLLATDDTQKLYTNIPFSSDLVE